MISYFYAGFDGHHHHGAINDRILAKASREELWGEVIDYVKECCGGHASVKISGTNEIIEVG